MMRALALLIFLPFFSFAQDDTPKNGWEIVEGAVPVNSEPQAMEKQARTSWKNACAEWEKKFREDNKENKIISLNCGTPECSGAAGKKVCSSTAEYKIKTKLMD